MLVTALVSLICGLLGTAIWQLGVKVYTSFPSQVMLFRKQWENYCKTVGEDDELINYHRYEGLKGLVLLFPLVVVQIYILWVINPWILLHMNKRLLHELLRWLFLPLLLSILDIL